MPDERFKRVEEECRRLKGLYGAGQLSGEQFEAALKQMIFQDAQGRYWTIGAKSGKWYVSAGQSWAEVQPEPGIPQAPAPAASFSPPPAALAGSALCPYPDCRQPLRAGVAFCPACGRSVAPAAPPAPPAPVAGAVCPHPDCRRPLRAGVAFCPYCGRSVVPPAPPTLAAPAANVTCPYPDCCRPVLAGAASCPHCRRGIAWGAPPAAAPPPERRCPRCGRVATAGEQFCAYDGTRVA